MPSDALHRATPFPPDATLHQQWIESLGRTHCPDGATLADRAAAAEAAFRELHPMAVVQVHPAGRVRVLAFGEGSHCGRTPVRPSQSCPHCGEALVVD